MEYLLKSSVIILLFYVCYKVFLQKETFFDGNRWFLLLGFSAAILIPLIVIPIYVEYTPSSSPTFIMTMNTISESSPVLQQKIDTTWEIKELIMVLYTIGIVFFMGKLILEFISLFLLIRRSQSIKNGSINYIETDSPIAPFSFFNWIVYNPNQFNSEEMLLILNHEKVHIKQFHSIDVIISQICCAIFWFNPFIWLYKKEVQQNLEFIADRETQSVAISDNEYQNLLLKTSIATHQMTFTNNFYNSLIKKRILMLHKSKSKDISAYKYALVLPLLILFVFNFNTEVVAQTTSPNPQDVKIGQNVLNYIITKDTKDSQLESIKNKIGDQDITLEFKELKRNDRKEITAIRIEYTSKKGSGQFFVNSDEPIKDIAINLNVNENKLTVGQAMKNLSQSFEIITEDGDKKVKTSGSGNNVFVYSTDGDDDEDEQVTVIGKDGEERKVTKERNVYVIKSGTTKNSSDNDEQLFVKKNKKDTVWIKKDVKNIVWTDDDGNDVEIITVEKDDNNIKIFASGNEKPLILLDGKEITKKEMEALDPAKIENVNVLKGDKATQKHGKKAEYGVIEITLKNN